MHRFVVVLLLEPLAAGERFSTAAWPLHATIVPAFVTGAEPDELAQRLTDAAADLPALRVRVLGDAMFGAERTIPVSEVERTPQLLAAHRALVAAAEACGIQEDTPEHWREGYRPHVSTKPGSRVRQGDVLHFVQVALIDMRPGPERRERMVVAVTPLPRAPGDGGGGGGRRTP